MAYLRNVLIGIDQLGNALLGGLPDETISARAYRKGWVHRQRIINWLFSDPNHCQASYEAEARRSHLPPEYRP